MVQILGGFAVILGLFFTWKSFNLANETQVTDRFSHAVDQLGNSNPLVRIGAIHALNRIANDSPEKDYWSILDLLVIYIRQYALIKQNPSLDHQIDQELANKPSYSKKYKLGYEKGKYFRFYESKPGQKEDIYSAVLALKDLTAANNDSQKNAQSLKRAYHFELNHLDLNNTDLSNTAMLAPDFRFSNLESSIFTNASMPFSHFDNANLNHCTLSNVDFSNSQMINASFYEAELPYANLSKSALWNTNFSGADLERTNFSGADLAHAKLNYVTHLTGANFSSAKLYGTEFKHSDLSKVVGLTRSQIKYAILDKYTKLPLH